MMIELQLNFVFNSVSLGLMIGEGVLNIGKYRTSETYYINGKYRNIGMKILKYRNIGKKPFAKVFCVAHISCR